jgi:hypothetical protein
MRAQKRGLQSISTGGVRDEDEYLEHIQPVLQKGMKENIDMRWVRCVRLSPQFCKVAATPDSAPINRRHVVSHGWTHAEVVSDSHKKGLDLGRLRCC